MRAIGQCSGGATKYCIKIKATCPEGIPPNDPGEECESAENCDICAGFNTDVTITCDGQNFGTTPNPGKNWGDVADDCSNLSFSP
jgi:hypothetical protein